MICTVFGGSSSGKSKIAEDITVSLTEKKALYIATMMPFDSESLKRIERHRKMRADKNFKTLECFADLASVEDNGCDTAILECLSNLTANECFSEAGCRTNVAETIKAGLKHLTEIFDNVVVVTNNIFEDGFEYDREMDEYLKILADVNIFLAEISDRVFEITTGVAVSYK